MSKIRVAIVGASGYAGEELIRVLLRHPNAEIKIVTSRQNAGKPVSDVFPKFFGVPLEFSAPDVDRIAAECDAAFLALPHGLASEYAMPLIEKGVRVFDISADFRLKSTAKYEEYYGKPHPAPELLKEAVYGQPERYRGQIRNARFIACPGCYPTSIILAAAPLLQEKLVKADDVTVVSMSGVTGAGRKVDLAYIFPECNESVRAYGVTGHRHLPEIEQELAFAAGVKELSINFIPHLVPMNRGIHSTILLHPSETFSEEAVSAVYEKFYGNERFVKVLPKGKLPDTKHVFMTNRCEIGFAYDKHTNKLIVCSVIDNLTKGASGQAVQAMNIRFGLPEYEGLD